MGGGRAVFNYRLVSVFFLSFSFLLVVVIIIIIIVVIVIVIIVVTMFIVVTVIIIAQKIFHDIVIDIEFICDIIPAHAGFEQIFYDADWYTRRCGYCVGQLGLLKGFKDRIDNRVYDRSREKSTNQLSPPSLLVIRPGRSSS